MKIIDKYLLKEFLKPFGGNILIFSILVIIGRFFDKMQIFNNFQAHTRDVVFFIVLGLPYLLNLFLTVATLIAVMLSLGKLQQQGEITAMKGAGIATLRLYRPLLYCGVVISMFSLIGGLSFLPKINDMSRRIYRVNIKQEVIDSAVRDHIVAIGREGRRFTIGWLDVDKNEMKDIVIDRFDKSGKPIETLTAKHGRYVKNEWVFTDAVLIHYSTADEDGYRQKKFDELSLHIPERPGDFIFEDKIPEDMTGGELVRRIRRLKALGASTNMERMALHMKIALPFAHIIVILLGIPFAIKSGQKARVQSFAWALGLTFFYWGTTSICQSLGEQGRLPPAIAAWLANIGFGGMALWKLIE